MGIAKSIKNSAFWQIVEVLVLLVSNFLYFGIMARILDKADYGLMALATGFVAIGTIFAEGGMGAALIQKKDTSQKHNNAALQGSIIFSLIIVAIFYLIAPLIARLFEQPMLTSLVRVISVNFVLLAASGVSLSLLQKDFRFRQSSIVTIIASVVSYGIGIIMGLMGYGVWSLVGATIINSLLKMIGYLYLAPVTFSLKWHFKEWRELFSFGSGMMIIKVNSYLGKNGIILVLGKIFSPSLLGVFERSFQIRNLPSSYLGSILIKIMFPALSKIQDDEERLFRLYDHGLGLTNSVLMPLSLFLIFFSEEIVMVMLGPKWSEAILPLQIMFSVLPLSISIMMTDALIRAKGLIYKNVWRKVAYVSVLLLTTGAGGYFYGINGAAVGVVVSSIVNYLMMIYLIKVVFRRSYMNVFYDPLKQGFGLCLKMGMLLLAYHFLIGIRYPGSVTGFLGFSILLVLLVAVTVLRFPSFFGSYIKITLDQVLGRFRLYRN